MSHSFELLATRDYKDAVDVYRAASTASERTIESEDTSSCLCLREVLALTPDMKDLIIEIIGWSSTAAFLFSIVVPNRVRLHQLGLFASVTTGVYAYAHGATAIWVKWAIAFFFHAYMIRKTRKLAKSAASEELLAPPLPLQ